MTTLSAQVKGSLNITTPGVQIWRIEVSPAWVCVWARGWGACRLGWMEGRREPEITLSSNPAL